MAIANSDGSIVLSTKVDTSGMEQGTKSLKSQAAKLAAEYRKAGMSQSEAFKKAWSEIERTRKETEKATKSTQTYGEKAKTAFQGAGSALKSLARYLALAFSVTKIIQFSNESASLATQTEASVQRLVDIYGSASDSVGDFIDANARALGMSKAAAASFSSVYGNLFSVWADQATNAELTNRYLNMTAVVASKTGRTVEDVQERVRSGLLGNTEAIEDLGIFVNVKTIEMTDAFQRMANGKSWEQLDAYTQQQIRSMAILEQATAKYGDEVADTSATIRNRYKAAYEDFKNSWGNIVNTVLLPILETLTQIFDIATKGLNALLGRSGQILENVELQEENTDKTAENIEEQTKNQKELNKELKKSLAGFDEIQILTREASDNGVIDLENKLDDMAFIGGSGDIESKFNPMKTVKELKEALDYILPLIETALVVIGLILLSTGNIPMGVGFIVASAHLYSVEERSGNKVFDFNVVKQDLKMLYDYLEEVLTVIGIILIFFGQIPWGVGFVIAGAVVYGVRETQSSEYDEESLKTKLAVIGEAISVYLAVIGVIMIMTGHVALGLGFLYVGKKLFNVSEKTLNENAITTKIQNFFTENQKEIVGVGSALVVIGVLMMALGYITPLSLGILAAGGTVLATEEQMNPGSVKRVIENFIQERTGEIIASGSALLVIGLLLVTSGVGVPAGIKCMAAGAGLLIAAGLIGDGGGSSIFGEMLNKAEKEFADRIAAWTGVPRVAIDAKAFEKTMKDIEATGGVVHPSVANGTLLPSSSSFVNSSGMMWGTNEGGAVDPFLTNNQSANGTVVKEEHYYLNETELMSVVYRLAKSGERLNGQSLIK